MIQSNGNDEGNVYAYETLGDRLRLAFHVQYSTPGFDTRDKGKRVP